ncbi:MAG: DUF1549 domain-containing protein [Planctomycetota bacterium]
MALKKYAPTLRWAWLALVVLIAFGVLIAGLAKPRVPAANASVFPPPVSQLDPTSWKVASISDVDRWTDRIDRLWLADLDAKNLDPAPDADWLTLCRRLSLTLVGSGVSLEEIRDLETLPEHQRFSTHRERLLKDPRFHHYFGERWARILVGTDGGEFLAYRRRRFRTWLAGCFEQNWTHDRLVKQLITAEGIWTGNPEVNFLTATFDTGENQPDPVRLAARTSRAFLGLRIDCLQCHDDFLGNVALGDIHSPREGLQSDFHQLASFFTAAKSEGITGIYDGDVDYEFQYLDASETVKVPAKVPFQPELLPEEGDARDRLAAWITHPKNRQAARAAVHHYWALIYGQPLEAEVDDLPLDSDPHPMLDALADLFVESEFNVRDLIRVLTSIGPFQVGSRYDSGIEVTRVHERHMAVFPITRLRPEQVAGALTQAARVQTIDRDSTFLIQLLANTGINEFVTRYGDVGEDQFSDESGTITQRLLMMNGDMLRELAEHNPLMNTSAHVSMYQASHEKMVEALYLATLNRQPTAIESEHFASRLNEADDRNEMVEDITWVLMNSSEMAWNH